MTSNIKVKNMYASISSAHVMLHSFKLPSTNPHKENNERL